MKRIGFLSFGHWQPRAGSQTRTAADALLQTIEQAWLLGGGPRRPFPCGSAART